MAGVPFINSLEGLRGLCAMLVVVYHAWLFTSASFHHALARPLLEMSFMAVNAFFVLSGFVLFLPVALRSGAFGNVRNYFLRRASRVFPTYYVAALVTVLAYPLITPGGDAPWAIPADGLFGHFSFLFTFMRVSPDYSGALGMGVNPSTWSMSVEVIYYAILPLIAFTFFRRPVVCAIGAIVFAWFMRMVSTGGGAFGIQLSDHVASRLDMTILVYTGDFALGMLAAYGFALVWQKQWAPQLGAALLVAGVASLVTLSFVFTDVGTTLRSTAHGSANLMLAISFMMTLFVAGLALAPRLLVRPLDNWLMVWFGKLCYGIYIAHYPVMAFLVFTVGVLGTDLDGTLTGWAVLVATAGPLTIALGWLSYRYLELPARRWARAQTAKAQEPAVVTAERRAGAA